MKAAILLVNWNISREACFLIKKLDFDADRVYYQHSLAAHQDKWVGQIKQFDNRPPNRNFYVLGRILRCPAVIVAA